MNAKLILFVSWFAAVTLATSVVNAGPRGHGGHGKHFSSMSPRGGHKFSRGTSGTYRNWNGRDWSVGYLGGRNWSGSYWGGGNWDWYPSGGLGIPYALNYDYYSYGYYPWYRHGFGYPYYWSW